MLSVIQFRLVPRARFASLFTLVFLLFFAEKTAFAQPVASSCDGQSSLIAAYRADAYQVEWARLKAQQNPSLNGVSLPESLRDSVLRAIFAVFNATALPARDTVFEQLDIHSYKATDLQRVQVLVDTSFGWTKNWLDSNEITGNSWIDYLTVQYGLTVEKVELLPEWANYDAAITLKTNQFVNPEFLAGLLANSTGVLLAHAFDYGGDGDHIFFETKPNFIEMTFRHGWLTCPTGCIFHRDWLFRVYPDCSVEYISSYGDLLGTVVAAKEVRPVESRIFPIPASESVAIQAENLVGQRLSIQISDLAGSIVRRSEMPISDGKFDGWLELDGLANGLYFLTLTTESQISTHQILKRL